MNSVLQCRGGLHLSSSYRMDMPLRSPKIWNKPVLHTLTNLFANCRKCRHFLATSSFYLPEKKLFAQKKRTPTAWRISCSVPFRPGLLFGGAAFLASSTTASLPTRPFLQLPRLSVSLLHHRVDFSGCRVLVFISGCSRFGGLLLDLEATSHPRPPAQPPAPAAHGALQPGHRF